MNRREDIKHAKKVVSGLQPAPLVIAGTASGVGKTTVAVGIMGALRRRGMRVAPFKIGPDYIDPGFHLAATGVHSRNLDTWLTGTEAVRGIFARNAAGADIAVIEGVMGLFDGRADTRGEGSTAEMAALLGGAVLLVADCSGMARSLAPLLAGFTSFDEQLKFVGVVLNNVGSSGHDRVLREAASEVPVTVLGTLPRQPEIRLPSRHLGLVPAGETGNLAASLDLVVDHVEAGLNLEALLSVLGGGPPGTPPEEGGAATGRLADGKGPMKIPGDGFPASTSIMTGDGEAVDGGGLPVAPVRSAVDGQGSGAAGAGGGVRIAVARDEAFSFYYLDSLEALEAAGADLVFFSPLADNGLPGCDGVYLGGGFPEMFAERLEANASMRHSLAKAAASGTPVYAECGGLIYLCRSVSANGSRYEMAGVIEAEATMNDARQALGYVEVRALRDNLLLGENESIRGHEFHWSTVAWPEGGAAYEYRSARRLGRGPEGFARGNLLASFVHVNFAGYPGAARRFVSACAGARGAVADAAR